MSQNSFENIIKSIKNIIHLYIWKLIDKPTSITNKSWDVLATCRREHLHQESVRFANAKTFYTHHKSCTGTCSLCKGITASQTYAYTIVRTMQQCMLRCVCGFSVKWGLQVLVAAAYLWHVPLLISIRIKLHASFSQVKLEITCVCNLHVMYR